MVMCTAVEDRTAQNKRGSNSSCYWGTQDRSSQDEGPANALGICHPARPARPVDWHGTLAWNAIQNECVTILTLESKEPGLSG